MKSSRYRIKLKQGILFLLLLLTLYILYMIVFGVIPYLSPSEGDKQSIQLGQVEEYYGNQEPSVDRAALIEASREGMDTRLHLIHSAAHTLSISYYATHWGESTEMFIAALLDAANRGVKVQFLIDGVAHHLKNDAQDAAYALAAHPNIELKFYNVASLLRPWSINGRLHDKYIIADNKLLLLGGRNIGDKYFEPEGFSERASLDRDVLVYNTAYQHDITQDSVIYRVQDYFKEIWSLETNTVAHEQLSERKQARADAEATRLLTAHKQLQTRSPHLFVEHVDYTKFTVPTQKISFIHNPIHRGKKDPLLWQQIRLLLQHAKEKVTIQSPYVVLNSAMLASLQDMSRDVKQFDLLTNSMATTPNPIAYSGYIGDRKKLLDLGAAIYEYKGWHSIHGKSYLIDHDMSIVGSYNLDPRSTYINTEVMLVIHGSEFHEVLSEQISAYKADSVHVNPSVETEAIEQLTELNAPLWKRVLIHTLSLFSPLFKFLL